MAKQFRLRKLMPLFSLVLFAGAAWILSREFKKYSFARIVDELHHFSTGRLLASIGITIFCYWMLTGYDLLGFRYAREKISYWRVTFAAFIAYAFANNLGMANFAGAAVRLRIYQAWRIATGVVAQVVALDVLSNWLGFFTVTGICFTISPPALPGWLHLPFSTARPVGLTCLGLLATYFAIAARGRPLKIKGVAVPSPRNPYFLAQVAVGCLDFTLGGAALYALLPAGTIGYWDFLCLYLLGQTAGIVSHVPGALGIFESVMLTCLSGRIDGARLLGALIVYRVIYFLIPFLFASSALALFELRRALGKKRAHSAVTEAEALPPKASRTETEKVPERAGTKNPSLTNVPSPASTIH